MGLLAYIFSMLQCLVFFYVNLSVNNAPESKVATPRGP